MHVPLADPLPRAFFARDPLRGRARPARAAASATAASTVRLTEVEAYAGAADPGSHAFRGRTPRNESCSARPGSLYVYFTYGMHWCANLVTGAEGEASAVLLRAGEVVDGPRGRRAGAPGFRPRDLARGPARLGQALALGREHNGMRSGRPARRRPRRPRPGGARRAGGVRTGPRVGVSGPGGDGGDLPVAVLGRRRPHRERVPTRAAPGTRRTAEPSQRDVPPVRPVVGRPDRSPRALSCSAPAAHPRRRQPVRPGKTTR